MKNEVYKEKVNTRRIGRSHYE